MFKLPTVKSTLGLFVSAVISSQSMAEPARHIDLPAGELSVALDALSKQSDVEIVYRRDQLKGVRTRGINGTLSAEQAVRKLLEGTTFRLSLDANSGAMLIAPNGVQSSATAAEVKEGDTIRLAWTEAQSPDLGGGDASSSQHPESSDQPVGLEEVIVTATKRDQNLQDVPFGISALTGDDLDRVGASGAEEYLAELPGVSYNAQGRGRSPIVIRGISTEGTNFSNLQPSTEIFIDSLPTLNRTSALSNFDLNVFDIERIEILRGPQGTLFGSGALGGAVRVITNRPDPSGFDARLQVDQSFTDGGDPSSAFDAMVNLPLGDVAALRAVAYVRDDGGWIDNVTRDEENANSGKTTGGRIMLGIEPTERLAIRLTLLHEDNELNDLPRVFADPATGGTFEWNGYDRVGHDISQSIANGVIDYDFGSFSLSSSTTYAERDQYLVLGADRLLTFYYDPGDPGDPDADHPTFAGPLANGFETVEWIEQDSETFAQEVTLTSNGSGPLLWTLGAFYMDQSIFAQQFFSVDPPAILHNDISHVDATEAALFGEVTYQFSDQLSVTAGARAFENEFEVSRGPGPEGAGAIDGPTLLPTTSESSAVTPKLSISYRPNSDLHFYATASNGYRIGQTNFNAGVDPNIPIGYGPDELWNYELGMKAFFMDHRLMVNAAVFHVDWSNIQLTRIIALANTPGATTNITDNAGDAEIDGFEAELTYRPNDNWGLGTSFSYLDATLVSVLPGVSLTPGSTLPGSPDFSMSNYVQFTTPLNNASAYVRLSHRYVGELYSNIVNTPFSQIDPYNVFNARAGVEFGNYEVALYVENIANDDSITSRDASVDPVVPYAFRLRPRTVGVTLRADF